MGKSISGRLKARPYLEQHEHVQQTLFMNIHEHEQQLKDSSNMNRNCGRYELFKFVCKRLKNCTVEFILLN